MSTITVEPYEAMVDDDIIGEHDQVEPIEEWEINVCSFFFLYCWKSKPTLISARR